MYKDVMKVYYGSHMAELEDMYLKNNPGYLEREKKLKETVREMELDLDGLGREAWLKC